MLAVLSGHGDMSEARLRWECEWAGRGQVCEGQEDREERDGQHLGCLLHKKRRKWCDEIQRSVFAPQVLRTVVQKFPGRVLLSFFFLLGTTVLVMLI